jgi:hypothetical protein
VVLVPVTHLVGPDIGGLRSDGVAAKGFVFFEDGAADDVLVDLSDRKVRVPVVELRFHVADIFATWLCRDVGVTDAVDNDASWNLVR